MTPNFRLVGLDPAPFEPLFALGDAELLAQGVQRRVADESPGYPCRVSLEDAAVGDELLLLPYRHQPAASPYRASGPIFVRRGARRRELEVGELPPYVTRRLISLRAYDDRDLMIQALVCEGRDAGAAIVATLADAAVAYLHLHNAKQGCFSCAVQRT